MQGILITLLAASFCAASRAFLSIVDRFIFQKDEVPFHQGIALNALSPLFFALVAFFCFSTVDRKALEWLLHPGVILSGLGAQLTAAAVSLNFRHLNVRQVIVSSKASDLLIPFAILLVSQKLPGESFYFTHLTTLAFLPIGWAVYKEGNHRLLLSFLLIGCLLFQALVNSLFHISSYSHTWNDFSRLMLDILIWRTIFILLPFLYRKKREQTGTLPLRIAGALFCRGLLAFFSQASFFFSITREESLMAWPILNAGPLLTCYVAEWFLKEPTGLAERVSLGLLLLVTVAYVTVQFSWHFV